VRTPWGGRLERYVESDRQIPKGFAGGPLIDADGSVIGMSSRTLIRGADLAVPAVTLRRIVAELQQHGGVRRGYLGVGTYPVQGGAVVANVEQGGPAATAGLLVGDVIVEAAGTAISGPDSLRTALADRPGETIKLAILRGGVRQELDVTLGSKA
jgi:S1-C subfamily serine protease